MVNEYVGQTQCSQVGTVVLDDIGVVAVVVFVTHPMGIIEGHVCDTDSNSDSDS